MSQIINHIQDRIAFFVPLLIFAGYFKSEGFTFAKWYLDMTLWVLIFIVIVQISRVNINKISIQFCNPVFLIILPMTFLILISILFEDFTFNAYVKIRAFVIILAPTVIVSLWAIKDEDDWRYLGNGVLALGLYSSFYICFNSIYEAWGSISYLFSGHLTALGAFVSLHRFLTGARRKWFYFLAFCMCSIGVLVSYARGQQIIYMTIVFVMLIIYFFSFRIKMLSKIIVFLCLFVLLGSIFIVYSSKVGSGENVLWRFKPQYIDEAVHIRSVLLKEAWKLFVKNPIIPAGIGKYVVEVETHTITYPHNMPLEFAAELGLFGLLFYCSITIGSLCGYLYFRQRKVIREHLILYSFILLCSLKQGCIYQNKAFWVWTAIGLSLLGWQKINKSMIEDKSGR